MQRTNGKPAARVTEPARRQSDPVMGPENPGTGLARHEAPTQRFSALQQRLLCSALHFFHRHIRSDPDVIQRMDGNHVFRQFYEVQYQTDKPNLDPVFSASVHDASALHVCSFILSILHQGIFSVSAFIVSVIYLSRFKEASHITLHACTWRPLFITALLVADKMWEDKPVRNSSLAKLFPVLSNAELNRMENRFLMGIKFNVLVKPDLFCSFCEKLLAENVHPDVLQCVSQSEYAHTLGPDPAAPAAPMPKEEKLNGVSHQSGNRAVAVTRTSVPAVMPQRAESAARSGSGPMGTDPRFATADQRVPMGGSLAVRPMARPEAANARVASSQRVAASHPAARAQSAGPGPYSATRSRVGGKPGSSRAESVQARDGRAASPAVGTPTADIAGAGTPTQDHSSPHPTQGLGPPAVHPRAARSSSPLLYVPPPRSGAPGTQLAPGSGVRGTSPGGLAARPAGTMQQAQRPASTGPSMRVGQPGPVPLSPSLPNGAVPALANRNQAQPVLAHHPPSPHFRTASPGVAMSRGGPTGMQGATAAATRSGSVPTAAGLAQQRGRSPAPGPPGVSAQPMLMPGTGHLRVLTPHRSSFGGPVMPHRLG